MPVFSPRIWLRAPAKVLMAAGSYLITGTAAVLSIAIASASLAASAGAYLITGAAATFSRTRRIIPEAGSYAIAGTVAALLRGIRFVIDAGSYLVTGIAAGLNRGWRLVAETASYLITGQTAAPEIGRRVVMESGAYATTGQGVTLKGPMMTLLASGTVSAAATLDIDLSSYTAFRGIKIVLSNFIPVTDGVNLQMQFSTDGGSTFDAGASDYNHSHIRTFVGGSDIQSGTSAFILLAVGIGNGAAEGVNADVDIMDQTNAAIKTKALFHTVGYEAADNIVNGHGSGYRQTAQDTDGVRFKFSSGNISSGKYAVYGWN